MKKKNNKPNKSFFEKLAAKATIATGSTTAIIIAFAAILIWGISGPFFKYSETWQLVINTGTTIITFLMVFLIQKSQNKESMATQLKLDELLAAHNFASNRLVDVENMSEEELKTIKKYYQHLTFQTKNDESLQESHSIDEADKMHDLKKDQEQNIREDIKTRKRKVS